MYFWVVKTNSKHSNTVFGTCDYKLEHKYIVPNMYLSSSIEIKQLWSKFAMVNLILQTRSAAQMSKVSKNSIK